MRKTLLLLTAGLLLAACYHAPVKPPVGYLFSDFSAPQGVYGDGSVGGSRVGRATTVCYLGLCSTGDSSVAAAARDGGITSVQQIDYDFYNMLGIVQEYTTVVHGE